MTHPTILHALARVPAPSAALPPTGSRMPTTPAVGLVVEKPAGIYLEQGGELLLIEPTAFSTVNTGSYMKTAWTWGRAKGRDKVVVGTPKATRRVITQTPSFLFYLETSAFAGMSSPTEFILARMDATSKGRELVVGKTAVAGIGGSAQVEADKTVEMKVETIRPGVFRVSPVAPLTADEYCFFYAGGGGKVFGFGVD